MKDSGVDQQKLFYRCCLINNWGCELGSRQPTEAAKDNDCLNQVLKQSDKNTNLSCYCLLYGIESMVYEGVCPPLLKQV